MKYGEVKYNNKMIQVLESKIEGEMIKLNINNLSKLFFPEFKKIYDCIIISSIKVEELEKSFNSSVDYLGGKNFYEISGTEILINSYLDMKTKKYTLYTLLKFTQIVIQIWRMKLQILDADARFCFIISCDNNNVTLRFHKVRPEESEWLVDDLNTYDEPIGYVIC